MQLSASVTPGSVPSAGVSLIPTDSPVVLRIGRTGGLESLWLGALSLLVAAAGLVSCAQLSPSPAGKARPTAAASAPRVASAAPAKVAAPLPRHKPAPPADQPAAGAAPVVPPAVPQATPAAAALRPTVDPARLVGLTEQETLRLLGPPSGTADVPPAKYWQYASSRCVLRVFFFMQMDTRDFRTLSYEIKSANHDPVIDQQCLADFVAPASQQR